MITFPECQHSSHIAFLDCGASDCFVSKNLVKKYNIPTHFLYLVIPEIKKAVQTALSEEPGIQPDQQQFQRHQRDQLRPIPIPTPLIRSSINVCVSLQTQDLDILQSTNALSSMSKAETKSLPHLLTFIEWRNQ